MSHLPCSAFLLFFPTPHVSAGNAERETQSPGMVEGLLGSSGIPKPSAQRTVRDPLLLPFGGAPNNSSSRFLPFASPRLAPPLPPPSPSPPTPPPLPPLPPP